MASGLNWLVSSDGSREVDDNLEADKPVTVKSQLDQYCARQDTGDFNKLTLLEFVKQYKIPKKKGVAFVTRNKEVLVIPRPYCSPDPDGPLYEQYCRQKLMLHQPFRQLEDWLAGYQSREDAYAAFLTEKAPISLADDIQQLEMAQKEKCVNDDNEIRDDMYTFGYHGYKILARGEK